MANHLYEVRISGGSDHKEWKTFYQNVIRLNAQPPDYGGIDTVCVLKHHMNETTVHVICTEGMRQDDDVTVTEITAESLKDTHRMWQGLVEHYYQPYGEFPNL